MPMEQFASSGRLPPAYKGSPGEAGPENVKLFLLDLYDLLSAVPTAVGAHPVRQTEGVAMRAFNHGWRFKLPVGLAHIPAGSRLSFLRNGHVSFPFR